MLWDIFVSYATDDGLDFANAVKDLFERNGINAFLAHGDIELGEPIDPNIIDSLEQCNTFIAIFTDKAAESKYVRNEILKAERMKKSIVICRKRSVDDILIPTLVFDLKRIDFSSTEELISEIEKKLDLFIDRRRRIKYPVLREGINKIPSIHELYEIAQRYKFLTGPFTSDESLHKLSKSVKIALAMEIDGKRSVSISLSLIYSTLRRILKEWINQEGVELPRRYEDAEKETGKALDILTTGVLKMMVHKNFISEMDVIL